MKHVSRNLVWLFVAMVFTLGAFWLWPQMRLADTLRRADQALRHGDYVEARQWYTQALAVDAQNVLALRGLSRADPSGAIGYLEHAWRLRPSSPLVQAELAWAYDEAGRYVEADALWGRIGIDNDRALELANLHFASGSFDDAMRWFDLYLRFNPAAGPGPRFQAAVAGVVSGRQASPAAVDAVVVRSLSDNLRISGGELQWVRADPAWNLDYGTPLSTFPSPPDLYGVMWWDGSAIAVVEVAEPTTYRLTARVRNGARESTANIAAPMLLEHNFAPIHAFTIAGGDQVWQDQSVSLTLAPGRHVIGLRCEWIEPDPVIDWVELTATP